jgi:hypothetical protein
LNQIDFGPDGDTLDAPAKDAKENQVFDPLKEFVS